MDVRKRTVVGHTILLSVFYIIFKGIQRNVFYPILLFIIFHTESQSCKISVRVNELFQRLCPDILLCFHFHFCAHPIILCPIWE